jgi:hypothetical protein
MLHRLRVLHLPLALALVCLLLLSACARSAGRATTSGGPGGTSHTSTPPVPCATHATTTALVYAAGQQVRGDIPAPSGPPSTTPPILSNFTYPLGIPHEGELGNAPTPSFTAIAPDAAHLAVAIQQFITFTAEYTPYIVDSATHAVSRVMLPHPITVANTELPPRLFAWADPHTLLIFANPPISNRDPPGVSYSYDLTTHTLTTLPGVSGAVEGVVRCSTLFYLTLGPFAAVLPMDASDTSAAATYINRYTLS